MTAASISPAHIARAYQSPLPRTDQSDETPQKTGASSGRRVADSVEISQAGLLSSELLGTLTPIGLNPKALKAESAAFHRDLGNKFLMAGIDTKRPITLAVDFQGQVKVKGDHPDKAKIEAMFNNDSELSNRFRRLSAASTLQKAVEQHMAFARDYEQNPQAAIAKHAHLFSGRKLTADYQFADDSWDFRRC